MCVTLHTCGLGRLTDVSRIMQTRVTTHHESFMTTDNPGPNLRPMNDVITATQLHSYTAKEKAARVQSLSGNPSW